jgi:hypothetical protein
MSFGGKISKKKKRENIIQKGRKGKEKGKEEEIRSKKAK